MTDKKSNKNFGITFSIIFFIIGVYPLLFEENVRRWSLIVAATLILVSYIFPNILNIFNKTWHLFGLFISSIMNPLIMGLIYWSLIFTTSLFVKLFKKNYLGLRSDSSLKTYWILTDNKKTNMRDQF